MVVFEGQRCEIAWEEIVKFETVILIIPLSVINREDEIESEKIGHDLATRPSERKHLVLRSDATCVTGWGGRRHWCGRRTQYS